MNQLEVQARAENIFSDRLQRIQTKTDRLFVFLIVVQWLFAIVLALVVSPSTWVNAQPFWHIHVWAAVFIGACLTVMPVYCALRRSGQFSTRVIIAGSQVLFSSLLIHLTGGRIETHFHIFGSLAFLSFYRDWRVFVPATLIVAVDHLGRAMFWPESVFGIVTAAPWRAIEHAAWVLFEDVFLIWGCLSSTRELREMANSQALVEESNNSIEQQVHERTRELEKRTVELAESLAIGRRFESEAQSVAALLDAQLKAIDRAQGRLEFDIDGTICDVNENFLAIMGYDCAELLGQHHRILVAEYQRQTTEYLNFLDRLRQGEHQQGEFMRVAKDGSVRWLQATYSPVFKQDGSVQKIVEYAYDVTEKKKLQGKLSEAQKLESIGELAAGIAHEINTPMQYVSDNVEYLKESCHSLFDVLDAYDRNLADTAVEKPWQERLAEIKNLQDQCRFGRIREQVPAAVEDCLDGIRRVIEIVRAMKQLSHPGTSEKVHTDINGALRSTATITRNRWKYAAELQLDLDPQLPEVKTKTAEVNQVLINLVVNAADAITEKFGEEGEKGLILVRTRAFDDHIVIEVEDNGCGMPEHVKRKIFEPFFTTKEVGRGTGQGLAISHNVIVNHHQGKLDVRTKPGEGTCFIVTLPTKTDEQDDTEQNSGLAEGSEPLFIDEPEVIV